MIDDLLFTGNNRFVDDFLQSLNKTFKIGTLSRGTETMKFHGFSIIQNDDFSSSMDDAEKISSLEGFTFSLIRRRQSESSLKTFEMSSFMFVNFLVGSLGIDAFPVCAFCEISLKQKTPNATFAAIRSQIDFL